MAPSRGIGWRARPSLAGRPNGRVPVTVTTMNDGAAVQLAPGEPIERALRRFKRQCDQAGLLGELRRRQHYQPPSARRRSKRARAVARQRRRAARQGGGGA